MSALEFGVPFKSLLVLEHRYGRDRRRKTLWRAQQGVWVEVATSTSTRVLCDRMTRGAHVVLLAGDDPNGRVDLPIEVASSGDALFRW